MRVLAVIVLAMVPLACKSTGGQYEMRAAAFIVPTSEEDGERLEEERDDSASQGSASSKECGSLKGANAERCVERTTSKSAKAALPVEKKGVQK